MVKNLPANARDPGSIPRSGKSPGERMATHSSILAWKISWSEALAWQATVLGVARVGHDLATKTKIDAAYLSMHLQMYLYNYLPITSSPPPIHLLVILRLFLYLDNGK